MLKTLISVCVVSVICGMAQPCQAVRLVDQSQPYANGTGEVVNILSGDTIDVNLGTQTVRVRFLGAAALETNSPGMQCVAQQARTYMSQLLQGQIVSLETDPLAPDHDLDYHLWRYVWVNGRLVNLLMIQAGYDVYSQEVPYQQQAQFRQAQKEAQDEYLGVWNPDVCGPVVRPPEVYETTVRPPAVYENVVIHDATPWSYPVWPYFIWGVELGFGGYFYGEHERHDHERHDHERHDRPNPHRTQPADRSPRHR
jgi:endonuclease YncB( thermonuclease family)